MDNTQNTNSENQFLIDKPLNVLTNNDALINMDSNLLNKVIDFSKKEYDETITFSHYYNIYQKFQYNTNKNCFFPYLINNDLEDSFFNEHIALKKVNTDSIDSILNKIKAFSQSHDYRFKKAFLENMPTYSKIIGLEKIEHFLLPVLSMMVDDNPGIKRLFLISLKSLIDYLCLQGDNGIKLIKENIINIIDTLYQEDHYEINNEDIIRLLYENLIKIAQVLSIKHNDYIVSLILNFANSESKPKIRADHKILSVKCIKKLVHYLNRDCCDSYFLPQLYSFSFDDDTLIRIRIMKVLPRIAEVCSLELINSKVLKITEVLSKDVIWNVRKTCVEKIPEIIKLNKERAIKAEIHSINSGFVEIINGLVNDNQKYVRLAILNKIGDIIINLTKEELSMKLLDFYVISVEEYYDLHGANCKALPYNKILSHFVSNFYFILLTYGVDYWFRLKKIFLNFCKEDDKQIQYNILSSLAKNSVILGEKITVSDLLPIYDKYLQSSNVSTTRLALNFLPAIMLCVPKENKQIYKKHFDLMEFNNKIHNAIICSKDNKEKQLALLNIIKSCYDLYGFDYIYSQIIRSCIILCFDDAYIIRKASAKVLAFILLYLYDNNFNREKLFKIIYSFSYNKTTKIRILFVKMSKIFIGNSELYKEIICDIFQIIIKDKIIDVRIALSKLFSNEKRQLYSNPNFTILCLKLLHKESNNTILNYFKDKKELQTDSINDLVDEMKERSYFQFHKSNNYLITEFNLDDDDDELCNELHYNKQQNDKGNEDDNAMYSIIK